MGLIRFSGYCWDPITGEIPFSVQSPEEETKNTIEEEPIKAETTQEEKVSFICFSTYLRCRDCNKLTSPLCWYGLSK